MWKVAWADQLIFNPTCPVKSLLDYVHNCYYKFALLAYKSNVQTRPA